MNNKYAALMFGVTLVLISIGIAYIAGYYNASKYYKGVLNYSPVDNNNYYNIVPESQKDSLLNAYVEHFDIAEELLDICYELDNNVYLDVISETDAYQRYVENCNRINDILDNCYENIHF